MPCFFRIVCFDGAFAVKPLVMRNLAETVRKVLDEEVKMARKLGAGNYIKKPYILEKIGLAVREELEK